MADFQSVSTGESLQALMAANCPKMDRMQVMNLFQLQIANDIYRRMQYTENERAFIDGQILGENDYNIHKIELKFGSRMCKTHASYIFKEAPSIQVPPLNSTVPEYSYQAAKLEAALYTWWKDESITKKMKRGILRASYKGDMIFYLTTDTKHNKIRFNVQEPDLFAFDTITKNPDSPFRWIMRAELMNAEDLKKAYPEYKDKIQPTGNVTMFTGWPNFRITDLYDLKKALFIEIMDGKYIYRYINDMEIEVKEHNLPFLAFYHLKYFDFGNKWGSGLFHFIKDPIKFLNQLLGYEYDIAHFAANPALVTVGNNITIDTDKMKGGHISLPPGASANYLPPPMLPMPIDKLLTVMKAFLHFLSGISEEAMAGFVGALTAAGVSIELRLDSTVREALDTQIYLQDMIQRINADYLRLMETCFPKKNLFITEHYGKVNDIIFPAKLVNGYYNNIIDFGGILPRSQDQIVRNVIAKYQGKMISLDTALEELRYADPHMEMEKIQKEQVQQAKLAKDLQSGDMADQMYFENPEDENDYMLTKDKFVLPHPAQDHQQHLAVHQAKYEKAQSELIMRHILAHQMLASSVSTEASIPLPSSYGSPQQSGQQPEQQQQLG